MSTQEPQPPNPPAIHFEPAVPLSRPRLTDEEYEAAFVERFWTYVDKAPGLGPKGDCWEWTGALSQPARPEYGAYGEMGCRTPNGYRAIRSHYAAWRVYRRKPPGPGKVLTLTCGNHICVREEHLRVMRRGASIALSRKLHGYGAKPKPKRRRRRMVRLTPVEGQTIRSNREAKGLRLIDLGLAVDCDITHIEKIEKGTRSLEMGKLETVLRLVGLDPEPFKLRARSNLRWTLPRRPNAKFRAHRATTTTPQY